MGQHIAEHVVAHNGGDAAFEFSGHVIEGHRKNNARTIGIFASFFIVAIVAGQHVGRTNEG